MKDYMLQGVCKYNARKGGCCDNWDYTHTFKAKNNKDAIKKARAFERKFKKEHKRSTHVMLRVSLRPVKPLLKILVTKR